MLADRFKFNHSNAVAAKSQLGRIFEQYVEIFLIAENIEPDTERNGVGVVKSSRKEGNGFLLLIFFFPTFTREVLWPVDVLDAQYRSS